MKRLTTIRLALIGVSAGVMAALIGSYHFGGVTIAAMAALAVPLALPFILGKVGNSSVRAQSGQPDQLKSHELRALADKMNGVLEAGKRTEEDLGITLDGLEQVDTMAGPLSFWLSKHEETAGLYHVKARRMDTLRIDQIEKASKKLTKIEEECVQELRKKVAEEERDISNTLTKLGYSTQETSQLSDVEEPIAGEDTLRGCIATKLEKRSALMQELEQATDELEEAYKESKHEFPSVVEFEDHIFKIRSLLINLDGKGAIHTIEELAAGIADRSGPRFNETRNKLLTAIDMVSSTGALESVDPQVKEDWKSYTRFVLDQENPLRYRKLLTHARKFPGKTRAISAAMEQACLEIDRIMQKDYIIEYKEKYPPIDDDQVTDLIDHGREVSVRLEHLKNILDEHEGERRIAENYSRVETRIRRILKAKGSLGPEDLKVRTPERYLEMFARRDAAVILENGVLRLRTDKDVLPRDEPERPESHQDDKNTRMEQEG